MTIYSNPWARFVPGSTMTALERVPLRWPLWLGLRLSSWSLGLQGFAGLMLELVPRPVKTDLCITVLYPCRAHLNALLPRLGGECSWLMGNFYPCPVHLCLGLSRCCNPSLGFLSTWEGLLLSAENCSRGFLCKGKPIGNSIPDVVFVRLPGIVNILNG